MSDLICNTAFIASVRGEHPVRLCGAGLCAKVNIPGAAPNRASESDGGQFDDRNHSNAAKVIVSGEDRK